MTWLDKITSFVYPKLVWLLPLIFALFCLFKFFVQGPFYLHQNGDFNYVYLLAGLDWLHLEEAGINDQPALPVKLVNALGILVLFAFRFVFSGARDMDTDVLANPESYLSVISLSVFFVCIWAYYRLLKVSQEATTSTLVWTIAACSIFFASIPFLFIFVNKPSPYLFIGGCWMASILIRNASNVRIHPAELSLCFLFAILSKFIVFPVVIALFFMRMKSSDLRKSLGLVILGITILYFLNSYAFEKFGLWLVYLFLHSDAYGSGSLTILPTNLFENGWKLIITNKLLIITLLASGWFLITQRNRKPLPYVLLGGIFVFLLMMVKLPNAHYFIFLYPLLTACILLIFNNFNNFKLERYSVLFVAFFMVLVSFSYSKYLSTGRSDNFIGETEKNNRVQTYFSSTQSYNLFLANQVSGLDHSSYLHSIYPTDTFYTHGQNFSTHTGLISYNDIRCKMFDVVGTSNFIEKNRKVEILKLDISGLRHHYTVRVKDVYPEGRKFRVEECK